MDKEKIGDDFVVKMTLKGEPAGEIRFRGDSQDDAQIIPAKHRNE